MDPNNGSKKHEIRVRAWRIVPAAELTIFASIFVGFSGDKFNENLNCWSFLSILISQLVLKCNINEVVCDKKQVLIILASSWIRSRIANLSWHARAYLNIDWSICRTWLLIGQSLPHVKPNLKHFPTSLIPFSIQVSLYILVTLLW